MRRQDVIVRISDGLGNQLFQLACGIQLARMTGRNLVLDLNEFFISRFFPIPAHLRRQYQLGAFMLPYGRLRGPRRIFYLLLWVLRKKMFFAFRFVLKIANITWVDNARRDVLNPMMMDYVAIDKGRVVFLSGIHCHVPLLPPRDVLWEKLSFPVLPECFSGVAQRICEAGERSVSVHVRRTDYVSGNICLSTSYYHRALERMRSMCPGMRFFVFSDDILWCRENLAELSGCEYVEGDWDSPWNDMHLMSLCRHHVIANSTFSWWGAYLSKAEGLTVYPDPWWRHSPIQDSMIPEGWIGISSLP